MSEAPSSMVDRVVLILSIFERSAEALTAGQISVRSGIPRSSVHRILQQLVSARWLMRHDDGYALGLRMFEIGSLVAHRSRITCAARPFIHEACAERTGQVVHLAVLDQRDVVYLDKVGSAFGDRAFGEPSYRSRRHAAVAGGRSPAGPLHRGREDAACPLARGHCRRVPRDGPAAADGRRPWRRLAALEAAIVSIRNSGYATDRDETVPGVACVAAPIRNFDEVVAAVSVCGPRDRMRTKDLPPLVMWTAAEISRSLERVASPLALSGT